MTDAAVILGALRNLRDEISALREQLRYHDHPEPMLTTKEAAEYLKVHPQEILRWVKCGLPYYETGRGWKFRRGEIDKFIQKFKKEAI